MLLSDKQGEIAVYNMIQVYECLKKVHKGKVLLKEIKIGTGQYCKWKNKEHTPRKPAVERFCNRLGVDYDVFVSKKIKVDFKINISFEE